MTAFMMELGKRMLPVSSSSKGSRVDNLANGPAGNTPKISAPKIERAEDPGV